MELALLPARRADVHGNEHPERSEALLPARRADVHGNENPERSEALQPARRADVHGKWVRRYLHWPSKYAELEIDSKPLLMLFYDF